MFDTPVPAAQQLLLPDPRPLVERLGREFFQQIPEHPGVYLMHDRSDAVVYVGKAKNLRKRLGSYRVANPDRLSRRHLRLLGSVAHIRFEACADEAAALARESELLRLLKPKFNRAGTWPAKPRYLAWRRSSSELHLSVHETRQEGWNGAGPLGGAALALRSVLTRLLWRAAHPHLPTNHMPAGWYRGPWPEIASFPFGSDADEAARWLERLLAGEIEGFGAWVGQRRVRQEHPFERVSLTEDLESLAELVPLRTLPASSQHPAAPAPDPGIAVDPLQPCSW